ncbi:hypothetical protein BKA70DRAFT_1225636 [Coprinopsis sp. MPI-PUGE-AT-0042]|nr:hypothetical protein BKA70DRAFT_1225636 [Coprinopsis sp. MPI-PUGE-AT-0042]
MPARGIKRNGGAPANLPISVLSNNNQCPKSTRSSGFQHYRIISEIADCYRHQAAYVRNHGLEPGSGQRSDGHLRPPVSTADCRQLVDLGFIWNRPEESKVTFCKAPYCFHGVKLLSGVPRVRFPQPSMGNTHHEGGASVEDEDYLSFMGLVWYILPVEFTYMDLLSWRRMTRPGQAPAKLLIALARRECAPVTTLVTGGPFTAPNQVQARMQKGLRVVLRSRKF